MILSILPSVGIFMLWLHTAAPNMAKVTSLLAPLWKRLWYIERSYLQQTTIIYKPLPGINNTSFGPCPWLEKKNNQTAKPSHNTANNIKVLSLYNLFHHQQQNVHKELRLYTANLQQTLQNGVLIIEHSIYHLVTEWEKLLLLMWLFFTINLT